MKTAIYIEDGTVDRFVRSGLLMSIKIYILLLFVISIIISTSVYGEIISENRDGVLYIYNTVPVVEKKVVKYVYTFDESKSDREEPFYETEEEYQLAEVERHMREGRFNYASHCFRRAGDYEGVMDALSEEIEQLEAQGDPIYSSMFIAMGDWDGYVKRIREIAEEEIKEENYMEAAQYYLYIWDTEKVKEMYKLQQQKARNTPH